MPAGQKWGLQCRFPQHWTNRWSERGGPSVWVLHRQLPSGVAPAVEHFLSQAEEGHRPLLGAQVVAPWGCLLLTELDESTEFSQHRWAVHCWVGRSWSMQLGNLPEYAWSYWQSRSGPCLEFSLVMCHGHPSLMKYFFRVFSNLVHDSSFSLEVNEKPLLAYSFTFILTLSFLPSWFSPPSVTSVRPSGWGACNDEMQTSQRWSQVFLIVFFLYRNIFQMPVSKMKMVICTDLASPQFRLIKWISADCFWTEAETYSINVVMPQNISFCLLGKRCSDVSVIDKSAQVFFLIWITSKLGTENMLSPWHNFGKKKIMRQSFFN